VAEELRADPADQRTLREWGRHVGASERTLARAFAAGAGVPFGRWRALLRLQAALPMLAAGEPVSRVAGRVGYDTPSAFVAAFRRETGQTPAAYFRARADSPAQLRLKYRGALDQDAHRGQRQGGRAAHDRSVDDAVPAAVARAVDGAAGHRVDDAALMGADSGERVEGTGLRLRDHDPDGGEDLSAADGNVGRLGQEGGPGRGRR
jgi:AraC-like DNA-binding protein